MPPARIQVERLSQNLAGRTLVTVLLTVILYGHSFARQNGSVRQGYTSCCAGSLCSADVNASQVPTIKILSGLRPNAPHIATLAREHTQRALAPIRDARLSRVELLWDDGYALEHEGPGRSDAWHAPTGALDVELLWDVRYLYDSSAASQAPSAATSAAAAAATGGATLTATAVAGGAAAGSSPAWNARVLGALEYATVPLLRAHASGDTSWLRQLDAAAAAGEPLPPQLMVPPPGQPGGPAAAPLLLLYRRDWWRSLVAAGGAGGSGGGSSGGESAAAEDALPPTWPLLAQLASGLLNRDLDGDGLQDHVLCLDLMPGCKGWALLSAIYASMVQTNGTDQGVWFNLTDLSPTLGGPALPAALRLYADLAASNAALFTPGGANASHSTVHVSPDELLAGGGAVDAASGAPLCGAVNPLFAAGRCLFTVDWAAAALRITPDAALGVAGSVGAALLPGSDMVAVVSPSAPPSASALNSLGSPSTPAPTSGASGPTSTTTSSSTTSNSRGNTTMQQCTAATCPYGDMVPAAALAVLAAVLQATPAEAAPLLVNRAPPVGDAANVWMLGLGQSVDSFIRVDDFQRLVGYQLGLKYLALQWPLMQQPQQLQLAPAARSWAAAAGVTADLEPSDEGAMLRAINASVAHPNAAMDILLPYSSSYREAIDALAADTISLLRSTGTPPPAARRLAAGSASNDEPLPGQLGALTAEAEKQFRNATKAFPYPSILLHLYRYSIGAPPPGGIVPYHTDGGSRTVPWRVAVPVAISIALFIIVVILAVCVVAMLRRRWRAKRWLPPSCRAKPPGAGPATTLALTDVQSSTVLWEVLSAELMDACMSIHHGIMRKAIEAHGGYEVFTEGDAFAVAFHGPDDALGFAIDVQTAMLSADWPPELLDHPEACEVWARRNSHLQVTATAAAAAAAAAASAAAASGMGSPRRITNAGVSITASGGTAGGGGGIDNSLLGLVRLTKGSKRLRALLGGGGSSRGGGASSITSGESFRASASAAMLRLLPQSAAAAAAAGTQTSPHQSQAQRPFSAYASQLEMAHGLSPTGAASALAAEEVEAVAAIAHYGSLGQAPWSTGGPRPLPPLSFDRFRNMQNHGSPAGDFTNYRPWEYASTVLRTTRVFGRQSCEGGIPWDHPAAMQAAAAVAAAGGPGAEHPPRLLVQDPYGYGTWCGAPGSAPFSLLPLPQAQQQQQQVVGLNPQVRSQSMQPPDHGQLAAQALTVHHVGGELLEQSITLSPQQMLQHPMRVPSVYLAASRSAGATAGGGGGASKPPMPPLQLSEDPAAPAAGSPAAPTPLGPERCNSLGPPGAVIRPLPEGATLVGATVGGNPKLTDVSQALVAIGEEHVTGADGGSMGRGVGGRTEATIPNARFAPVPGAAATGPATPEAVPVNVGASAPLQPSPSLPLHQQQQLHQPLLQQQEHRKPRRDVTMPSLSAALLTEPRALRKQLSHIALPLPPLSPTLSLPSPLASPPQQQPHHRRGAVRAASRLSLVSSIDRDGDAAAAHRGSGRRGRLLSLFSGGWRNGGASGASSNTWGGGALQPERSAATLGPQRLASFTVSSAARSGAGGMGAHVALAAGRSLSFTARQRPDPDRLWPMTRGSPLQPIMSGGSGRSVEVGPVQQQQPPQQPLLLYRQYSNEHVPQVRKQQEQELQLSRHSGPGQGQAISQQQEQQEEQEQRQLKEVSSVLRPAKCAADLLSPLHRAANSPPRMVSGGEQEGAGPNNAASPVPDSASNAAAVPRRVSFKLAGQSTTQPDPNLDLPADPEPDRRPDPKSDSKSDADPGHDLGFPERIPGRDWSLNPWLDLQVVRNIGDLISTREALGGLPSLVEGHEGDDGTTGGSRVFESHVASTSRQLPSRDDWQWQPSRPDISGAASRLASPQPLVIAAAAAAALAGPRADGPRPVRRNSGSTASSRRRSTGCSFESSGSAGDVWRALHELPSSKAAKRRSAMAAVTTSTATMTTTSLVLQPAPRVPLLQVTGALWPNDAAAGSRAAAVASAPTPASVASAPTPTPAAAAPPLRCSDELKDAVTVGGVISSVAAAASAAMKGAPEAGLGSVRANGSGSRKNRNGGSGGGGDVGGGGNDVSGQLVAIDVDVLLDADCVLRRAGRGNIGGGVAAASGGGSRGGGCGRVAEGHGKAPRVPVRSASCEPMKAETTALSEGCEEGGGAPAGGGSRRRRGGGSCGAVAQRHDPAAALSDFEDGAGGLEWRSVVSWEEDLKETSGPLDLESTDICQQTLQTIAPSLSQQLPTLNPHAGGGGGKDADGSHAGASSAAVNRTAFFRTWRNSVAQASSEVNGVQQHLSLHPPRRHACNGASGIASGGGGSSAVTTAAGAVFRTHMTLHPGDIAPDASSQEDLRRTSSMAGGSAGLLTRLGHAVRKAVLRGTMGDRDRERDLEELPTPSHSHSHYRSQSHSHAHARSEGAAAGSGTPSRLPGFAAAQAGAVSAWLQRPSRLRTSTDATAAAPAAGGERRDGGISGVLARASGSSSGFGGSDRDASGAKLASGELSSGEGAAGGAGVGDGIAGGRSDGGEVKEAGCAEGALISGASMGTMGAEVSAQSIAAWDSGGAAGQLATGGAATAAAEAAAAAAVAVGTIPPHPGPASLQSMALAVFPNDSDDARSYYMRPEYVFASGPGVLLGNIAAASAAIPTPPPPVARAPGEDGGVFDLLWRDLNAAAAAAAPCPPPALPERSGPSGTSWPQAAVATVASALRLLYDQLTHAEAVLSYIMEGGSGVHRESSNSTVGGGGGGPELVLRGLRIRIGLHSGPREGEVELSVVDGVAVGRYLGEFLATCKEVSEAAVGGMVVLSGAAFRAYHGAVARARSRQQQQQQDAVMLLHVGDHIVRSAAQADPDCTRASTAMAAAAEQVASSPARELYAAVSPGLLARLAVLPGPVRTAREVVPGCLSAPAGVVAPVFCNVVGVESLLAWEKVLQARMLRKATTNIGLTNSAALSQHQQQQQQQLSIAFSDDGGTGGGGGGVVHMSLELLRNAVSEVAAMHDGYVVASSADGGHWVLVFGSTENAVLWGLGMLEAMLTASWPEGLLEHELAEEVWEGGMLLKRGLRLRIGIDCGRAMVRLVPRTGRLDYVGKPLNRAARIAAKAKAATMLVSGAVWASARPSLEPVVDPTSLGLVQLKGVKEPLELWALKGRQAGSGGGGGGGGGRRS